MDHFIVCLTILFAIVQVTSCQSNCTNYYLIMEETVLGTQYFLEPLVSNLINWQEFSDVDEITNCLIELECLGIETTCEKHYDIKSHYGPDEHIDTNSSWSFPFAWFSSHASTTVSSTTMDTVDDVLLINEICYQNMADFISYNQCTQLHDFIGNYTYLYDCQITEYNECQDAMPEAQSTNVNKCTSNYVIVTESFVNNNYLEPLKMHEIIDWRSIVHVNETSCYLELDCSDITTSCVKAHNIEQLYENRKRNKGTDGLITDNENSVNVTTTLEDPYISLTTLSPLTTIFEDQRTSTESTYDADKDMQGDLTVNIDDSKKNCTFMLHLCNKIANFSHNSTYIKCKYFEESCTSETNKLTSTLEIVNGKLTDSQSAVINNITTNSTDTTQRNSLTKFEVKELQKNSHVHQMDKHNNRGTNDSSKLLIEVFKELLNKTEKITNETDERSMPTSAMSDNNIISTEITQFETSTKFTYHEFTKTTQIETSTESIQIDTLNNLTLTTTSTKFPRFNASTEFTHFETTTQKNKKTLKMTEGDKELNENIGETGASSKEKENDHTEQIFFTVVGAVLTGTILYLVATKIRDYLKSGQYRIPEDQTVNQEFGIHTSEM